MPMRPAIPKARRQPLGAWAVHGDTGLPQLQRRAAVLSSQLSRAGCPQPSRSRGGAMPREQQQGRGALGREEQCGVWHAPSATLTATN